MALESHCLRHRPAAASEGQDERRGGSLRKSKAHAKKRLPWRFSSCSLRLRLPSNRLLDGHRPALAPHSWASPPLIKDAAEPPGLLVAMRGLVELTK